MNNENIDTTQYPNPKNVPEFTHKPFAEPLSQNVDKVQDETTEERFRALMRNNYEPLTDFIWDEKAIRQILEFFNQEQKALMSDILAKNMYSPSLGRSVIDYDDILSIMASRGITE